MWKIYQILNMIRTNFYLINLRSDFLSDSLSIKNFSKS